MLSGPEFDDRPVTYTKKFITLYVYSTEMMKKILTILALSLFTLGLGAQELGASFVQNKTIKATGRVIRGEGVVFFTAPDQLRMNYLEPKGEYLIIDGDWLRSNVGMKQIDVDTTKNPTMRGLRNTLLNCIMGEYEKAAQDNNADVAVENKAGGKEVTLTARKQAARGYSKIVVEYNAQKRPVRMVMDEFNGVSTEYTFEY